MSYPEDKQTLKPPGDEPSSGSVPHKLRGKLNMDEDPEEGGGSNAANIIGIVMLVAIVVLGGLFWTSLQHSKVADKEKAEAAAKIAAEAPSIPVPRGMKTTPRMKLAKPPVKKIMRSLRGPTGFSKVFPKTNRKSRLPNRCKTLAWINRAATSVQALPAGLLHLPAVCVATWQVAQSPERAGLWALAATSEPWQLRQEAGAAATTAAFGVEGRAAGPAADSPAMASKRMIARDTIVGN